MKTNKIIALVVTVMVISPFFYRLINGLFPLFSIHVSLKLKRKKLIYLIQNRIYKGWVHLDTFGVGRCKDVWKKLHPEMEYNTMWIQSPVSEDCNYKGKLPAIKHIPEINELAIINIADKLLAARAVHMKLEEAVGQKTKHEKALETMRNLLIWQTLIGHPLNRPLTAELKICWDLTKQKMYNVQKK